MVNKYTVPKASKRVNNWLSLKVEPRDSKIDGVGEFAIKNIKKGELIAVFGGHVMTIDEVKTLPSEIGDLALGIADGLLIGPISVDEIDDGDWFNHSCDPNAGILGQIKLVAIKDIKAGEEITFDYVMTIPKNDQIACFDCNCNNNNCRQRITNNDWQKLELQQKYKGYFSQFVQESIDSIKN